MSHPSHPRPLRLAPLAALLCAALVAAGPTRAAAADDDEGIETARTSRLIAPGVRLESYDRLQADRWLRIDELVADLGGADGVRAEYLGGPGRDPTRLGTLAEAAVRHQAGPGRRVVGAVNGDFFDIRGTKAPLGPGLRAGRFLHSASPGPGGGLAIGFGPEGSGRLLRLGFRGTVTLPGGAVRPLAGYNAARPPADGFALYTDDWPGTVMPAAATRAVELRDGRVTGPARQPIGRPASGTALLVASGPAAAELGRLRPGDPVAVTALPLPASGGPAAAAVTAPAPVPGPVPVTAIGGREPLVLAGTPQNHDGEPNDAAAPRTAVGLSDGGRRLRLVTVDGRQRDSGGLSLTGLGRMMRRLGASEALNLDGGGSSTLLAGRSGATALTVENSPSDGVLRPVPNGLVLTAPAGSGHLTGYRVEPVAGSARAFPGLTRTFTATGHDLALGPAPGAPQWSARGGGSVGPDGVFHALRPGPATVTARRGAATGALRLDVLGPLTRLRPTSDRIGLAGPAEHAGFALTGYDAQGAAAPVEPRDVALRFDRSRWSVSDDGRGAFTVTARVPHATGRLGVTVRATGATAELALGVGLEELPLAAPADAARWTGPGAQAAPGALALAPARAVASAAPPGPLPVPELARSVSLWVTGDGSGARPTVHLADADGAAVPLRGPAVTWSGRRRITLPLPARARPPLTLTRLSAAPGARPGRLLLDTLTAATPPTGPAPAVPAAADPVVGTTAQVAARPWRFAVVPAGQAPPPGVDFVLRGGRPGSVHRGVRFVPLDSGRRTLEGGAGLHRMRAVREALAAAAREPDTGAVAVVERHAPQSVDRKEAALLEDLLAEFRRTTGKRAVLLTLDAPRFAAGRSEGVLSVAAARGERTLIGVDAFAAGDWLSVRPGA
ncbi:MULTISPECIES: phosphodiester glycosidase family protein [unclassified Streptomyces]|uniref:phosphodiester glycosidase family protein n=1 Tax=unclassified Streptomyces TaxID=2593676 RepID=UPI002E32F34D|nr:MULTISPECIES: phosphodiester glycosidase family protein [unclassified Streptomyces]WUC67662.1 phosphodiester glycosidase family protein [Streptomyces sp. NBC_00539]